MNNSQLILESRFVDYDDTSFKIKANNEHCAASLEFYGTPKEFFEFGAELVNFPKDINHEVHYPPLGTYDENITYAYYLTIKAFCYDPSGHAALEINLINTGSVPYSYEASFYIQTDVASLNRLGKKLIHWDVKDVSRVSLYDEE
jgi:hypothetical protein